SRSVRTTGAAGGTPSGDLSTLDPAPPSHASAPSTIPIVRYRTASYRFEVASGTLDQTSDPRSCDRHQPIIRQMIEGILLCTVGAVSLAGSDRGGLKPLVRQPKRAVLLVSLTVARPKGLHRRDTLLALLWPDADQAHARHALSQLVYQLRRTLGADAIVSEGDEATAACHTRVWRDVRAFDAAGGERRG